MDTVEAQNAERVAVHGRCTVTRGMVAMLLLLYGRCHWNLEWAQPESLGYFDTAAATSLAFARADIRHKKALAVKGR